MINVVEVKTKKQQREFVDFPTKLYNGNDYYVHPLRSDELNLFSPKKNVSYDECEIVFYLAYKNGKVAGRICGIVQKVYNEKTNLKKVRFSRFDCIEDFEVAKALFDKVEEWARLQGMTAVHGPLGFNDLDREGLLIEGYDRLATFEENYNYPYYKEYIEKLGYKKDSDYLAFRIKLPKEPDPRVQRIADLVMKRYGLHLATEKTKKRYIKRYMDKIFDLIDEAYGDLYGVIPYNEKLRKQIADQFNLIIRKDFIVSLVNENDEVIAFGFALPSLAEAVQKCKGNLFPTGLFRILHATKHISVVDFGLVAVRKSYQGKGLTAPVLQYIVNTANKVGFTEVETNHSLEDNYKILQTWKNFDDVEQHKRFRCFIKNLDDSKPEKQGKVSKSKSPATKSSATKSSSTKSKSSAVKPSATKSNSPAKKSKTATNTPATKPNAGSGKMSTTSKAGSKSSRKEGNLTK